MCKKCLDKITIQPTHTVVIKIDMCGQVLNLNLGVKYKKRKEKKSDNCEPYDK